MVALPILAILAYNFLLKSNAEIQQNYPISAYFFLCSIFVALTNQVCGILTIFLSKLIKKIILKININQFSNYDRMKLRFGKQS